MVQFQGYTPLVVLRPNHEGDLLLFQVANHLAQSRRKHAEKQSEQPMGFDCSLKRDRPIFAPIVTKNT